MIILKKKLTLIINFGIVHCKTESTTTWLSFSNQVSINPRNIMDNNLACLSLASSYTPAFPSHGSQAPSSHCTACFYTEAAARLGVYRGWTISMFDRRLWNSNVNEKPGKAVTSQWPAYIHLLYLSTICGGHFWWWALQFLSESLITAAATRICTLRINFQVIVHFLQRVSVQFVAIKLNFFTLFCFLEVEKLHTGYWLSGINYLLSDITCTFSCQVLWSWSVVIQTLECPNHWLIKVLGIEILILKFF